MKIPPTKNTAVGPTSSIPTTTSIITINTQPAEKKNTSTTTQQQREQQQCRNPDKQSSPSTWQQPSKLSPPSEAAEGRKDTAALRKRRNKIPSPTRRLKVQDRISFVSGFSGGKPAVGKSAVRRMSSDVLTSPAVLGRWSGAGHMTVDCQIHGGLGNGKEDAVETKVGTNPGTQLTDSLDRESVESDAQHHDVPQSQLRDTWDRCSGESIQFPQTQFAERVEGVGFRAHLISQFSPPPKTTSDYARNRQSKPHQELFDELKMKANELEKLFAEHKLRVSGDQSSSARRYNPISPQVEQVGISPLAQLHDQNVVIEPLASTSNMSKLIVTPPVKVLDNQDHGDADLMQSSFGLSDYSRGKFYENYMQRRDSRLREESGSKRAEKEAKMKALQDSFERSAAEMNAKFSKSAQLYAERRRSFSSMSTMKMEQHPIALLQIEDEEDLTIGNGVYKSSQANKLPNKNLHSSIPSTSPAPLPGSATRTSNSSIGQQDLNFSDLRKGKAKPCSSVSKPTTRPQTRTYARSKSTCGETTPIKEEKLRHSRSPRKSTVSPEFKGLSALREKFSRNMESKPFLKKGSRVGPVDGSVMVKMKASVESETMNNLEESDVMAFDPEESLDAEKDEENEEFEATILQDPANIENGSKHGICEKFSRTMEWKESGVGPGDGSAMAKMKASRESETMNNSEESDVMAFDPEESLDAAEDEEEEEFEGATPQDHENIDNGNLGLTQEFEKSVDSGSESGDASRSSSQVAPAFGAELPSVLPSTFHPVGSVQHSPAGSPVSRGNSRSLNQAESGVARTRKKWGSPQRPMLVSNSSPAHSQKDVTKGFKRLLTFRRKSSEDLMKSKMGFSKGHRTDDSFNKSERLDEEVQALQSSIPAPPVNFKLSDDHLSGSSIKAPRSLFSLPSFRNKGGDSKPR